MKNAFVFTNPSFTDEGVELGKVMVLSVVDSEGVKTEIKRIQPGTCFGYELGDGEVAEIALSVIENADDPEEQEPEAP